VTTGAWAAITPRMSKHPVLNLPIRPRRLRRTPWLRSLVAEHTLRVEDLIWPLFVQEGANLVTPVEGLPGVSRLSIDKLVEAAREAVGLGIPAIALFPVNAPDLKSVAGDEALNPDNLLCRAIRAVKAAVPEIGIIADVALDPYTTHGHDGLLDAAGDVANDATVAVLCKQALVLAEAGCDIVAPSDMMDGRIGEIRAALDGAGHVHVVILAYAAKYASAFYGPFRAAVGSKNALGKADKRTYQMNPANAIEAEREVLLDLAEGADMVMVKPASLYLDVIARAKELSDVPVFAYHVSGEYAMLKAAAAAGMLDEKAATLEVLLACKRAGADAILTYAARDVAQWLRKN
jgi:porphobilinogen synthase